MKAAYNKEQLYFNAYSKTLLTYKQAYDENPNQDFKDIYKKLIVYAIKYVNAKEEPQYITLKDAKNDFLFVTIINNLISLLTPKEFMQLFPIDKEFKGHKWGMKDYFYTRDYLQTLEMDKPIEKVTEFLWEYTNKEIFEYNLKIMEYMSRLRRLDGKPSLGEEFAKIMGLKTYKMHKDIKGNEFLIDEDGKAYKLKKRRPFKVIKGRQ